MFVKDVFPIHVLELEAKKKRLWELSEIARDAYWRLGTRESLIEASRAYNQWQMMYTDHCTAVSRAMTDDY